jgi:hypothetical protein
MLCGPLHLHDETKHFSLCLTLHSSAGKNPCHIVQYGSESILVIAHVFRKETGPTTLNVETSYQMVTCGQKMFAVALQRDLRTVNGTSLL